jgi:PAB-dependent poly(A)-specific ribonuclease subunit 2
MVYEVGRLPPKIDPDIVSVMKRGEIGYYAPNLKKVLPNYVEYTRLDSDAGKAVPTPKFLSEKAKEVSPEDDRGFGETVKALKSFQMDNPLKREVPHIYQNVEIKYSKFGVDDFDFE